MEPQQIKMLALSRDDVEALVGIKDIIEVVEEAVRLWGLGEAIGDYHHTLFDNAVRENVPTPRANFQSFSAYLKGDFDVHGIASCASCPHNPGQFGLPYLTGILSLNDRATGAPLAVIDVSRLVELVTAAVSAVGVKYLANEEASVLGILGCGNQGRMHVDAVMAVRKIEKVVAFDIKPEVLAGFAEEMGEKTGLPVEAANSAESAVRASDIVTMLISSPRPTIRSNWLKPGAAVVAASGFGQDLYKDDVYRNADNIVMDDWGSYMNDCLADIGVTEEDRRVDTVLMDNWKRWKDGADPAGFADRILKGEYGLQLPDIVLGRQQPRSGPRDTSVFLHAGLGANFVAAGHLVYTRARERGLGAEFRLL